MKNNKKFIKRLRSCTERWQKKNKDRISTYQKKRYWDNIEESRRKSREAGRRRYKRVKAMR